MKPTYFFSDLHLGAPGEARCQRLLELLKSLEGRAEAIYFVCDAFDFWLAYRSVIFSAYFPFLRQLARLTESGVQVIVFSGNHDPDLGPFLESLGVEVQDGPKSITLGNFRVRLEHGDTIDPRSWFRRAICIFARHPLVRRLGRWVHPDLAWRLTRWYAEHPHRYDSPLPSGLMEDYLPSQIQAGYDAVIMGHYHRAVNHRYQDVHGTGRLYVLGDWVHQRTFLRYDGEFELLRDCGPEKAPDALAPGDHAPAGQHATRPI